MVSEADTPPQIRAGLLQSTLIVLPAEEKVANVFAGDTVDWVFDGGHVASRFISVKPKIGERSDRHSHRLRPRQRIHACSCARSRMTPIPTSIPKSSSIPATRPPKTGWRSCRSLCRRPNWTRRNRRLLRRKPLRPRNSKPKQTKAEQYRSEYPGSLHFDYTWDERKGKELGLQQIWRDDKFTYLRGQFQETPALYEVKDGKASLINFDFNDGLYTVPKQLEHGYLAIGKQKVEFHRDGRREVAMPEPNQNPPATVPEQPEAKPPLRKSMPVVIALVAILALSASPTYPACCAATRRAAPASTLPMRPASPNAQQVSSFETQQQLQAQHDAEERQRQQELAAAMQQLQGAEGAPGPESANAAPMTAAQRDAIYGGSPNAPQHTSNVSQAQAEAKQQSTGAGEAEAGRHQQRHRGD